MGNIYINTVVLDRIKANFAGDIEELKRLKWNWKNIISHIESLYAFIKKLVVYIEKQHKEYNAISKGERIVYAAKVLDDTIEFKEFFVIIEAFDDQIFKALISLVVTSINDFIGHNWNKI